MEAECAANQRDLGTKVSRSVTVEERRERGEAAVSQQFTNKDSCNDADLWPIAKTFEASLCTYFGTRFAHQASCLLSSRGNCSARIRDSEFRRCANATRQRLTEWCATSSTDCSNDSSAPMSCLL